MYTTTKTSDPPYSYNHKKKLDFKTHDKKILSSLCLPNLLTNQRSSHPLNLTSKPNTKGILTVLVSKGNSNNSPPEAPIPAKPSSSKWKKWLIGLIFALGIPSTKHKWGPLLVLKSKVDAAIESVESVTEVVEELAEEVEKVSEEVDKKLPGDAKLKEAVESVEKLAKEAIKEAELANDIIHKVRDAEKSLEKALMQEDIDQTKGITSKTIPKDEAQPVKKTS